MLLNLVLSLTQYRFSIWLFFSAFARHTFNPRPQEGVFRCDLNKKRFFYYNI
jgi:hypothetical protein